MKKTEKIEVRLSEEVKVKLAQLADAEQTSLSEMIRDLANSHLQKREDEERSMSLVEKVMYGGVGLCAGVIGVVAMQAVLNDPIPTKFDAEIQIFDGEKVYEADFLLDTRLPETVIHMKSESDRAYKVSVKSEAKTFQAEMLICLQTTDERCEPIAQSSLILNPTSFTKLELPYQEDGEIKFVTHRSNP